MIWKIKLLKLQTGQLEKEEKNTTINNRGWKTLDEKNKTTKKQDVRRTWETEFWRKKIKERLLVKKGRAKEISVRSLRTARRKKIAKEASKNTKEVSRKVWEKTI